MKKILYIAAAAILALSLFTGCSKMGNSSSSSHSSSIASSSTPAVS